MESIEKKPEIFTDKQRRFLYDCIAKKCEIKIYKNSSGKMQIDIDWPENVEIVEYPS